MKAIGIKMVELQPMRAALAIDYGYKIGNAHPDDMGYEVTYQDGYKIWSPKEIVDAAYYPLYEKNDGTKILGIDVMNFITNVETMKVGDKTTVVNAHTRTGFDIVRHSSCVDPNNYDEELGKELAMEKVVDDLWGHLSFVLQWAKYSLNEAHKLKESKYPAHIERVINEYKELADRITKLAKFISENEMFKTLFEYEQKDMRDQLFHMNEYLGFLSSQLSRAGVDINNI